MSSIAAFRIRRPQMKVPNAHLEWYFQIQEFSHIVVLEVLLQMLETDGEREMPEGG
jgi:hypothetical protein